MTLGDSAAPVAGRLLSAMGLQSAHLQLHAQRLQRSPVSATNFLSIGAAYAAVHAFYSSPASSEAIAPISLELVDWPSAGAASTEKPPRTTANSFHHCECDGDCDGECNCSFNSTTIPSLRRRYIPPHTRTNSFDSTTSSSSTASRSSSSSTRSRWSALAPVPHELTASNSRCGYVADKKSKQSKEVWREYCLSFFLRVRKIMSGFSKFRAGVTAAGCAAIIFTGATFGAGWKTQEEWKEERQKLRESPVDEQIAFLEGRRSHLASERANLERKLRVWEERIQERRGENKPAS